MGANSSSGHLSHAPSPPLVSFVDRAPASSRPPSHASSRPSSSSGYGMSARGGRGGARGHVIGRGHGGGGRGGNAGLLEPPPTPATLAVEHHARMEANAPGVVLPHHTEFGLGESVALLEADLLRLAAVGGRPLCANVAAAVGVPAAMQGLLYVRCLHHWRKVPVSACRILVGGMAYTRCRHIMQQACRLVS